MLQPFSGQVVRIRAEAIRDARIPQRACVDGLFTGFTSSPLAIEDRVRPLSTITERRDVVFVEDAEHRQSKASGGQCLDAGGSHLACVGFTQPTTVWCVHELLCARIERGQHRRHADGVHHRVEIVLLALIYDDLQNCDLQWRGFRINARLDDLDAGLGILPHLRAGQLLGLEVVGIDAARRDDPRALQRTGVHALLELEDARHRSAARHQRGEARVEELLHPRHRLYREPALVVAAHDVTMRIDEPRECRHSFRIDGLAAATGRRARCH